MSFLERKVWFVCLGNPGLQYSETRHNAGFMVADYASFSEGFKFKRLYSFKYAKGEFANWVKPTTYMNLSGMAVGELLRRGLVRNVEDLVIIYDDFHIPIGRIKLKRAGSSGGHNGMRSIIEVTGENIKRIRIGIGPKPNEVNVVDFVLGKFSHEEMLIMKSVIRGVYETCRLIVTAGFDKAQNFANGKDFSKELV